MNQTYPTHTADGREIYEWGDPFMSPDLVKLAFEGIDSAAGGVHLLVTRYPERVREMWPIPLSSPCRDGEGHVSHDYIGDKCRKCDGGKRPNVIILVHCETQAEVNAAASHLASLSTLCGVVGLELVPREMIDTSCVPIANDVRADVFRGIYTQWCDPGVDHPGAEQEFDGGPAFRYLTIHGGDEPCHPDWIRGPIRQAEAAQVPVWFGGWGRWWPRVRGTGKPCNVCSSGKTREIDGCVFWDSGSARSGRTLDGREWDGVPVMPINS